MITLPCKTRLQITRGALVAVVTITDYDTEFLSEKHYFQLDDKSIIQEVEMYIDLTSLWPIIRELERFCEENNIKEQTNETITDQKNEKPNDLNER